MKSIYHSKYLIVLFILLASNLNGQKNTLEEKHLLKGIKKIWKVEAPNIELLLSESSLNGETTGGKKIYSILNDNKKLGYAYSGRVNSCREGGCSADFTKTTDADFEYFEYLILFDIDLRVELVRVYNYQATHGQEICSPGWLKQFIGYNGEQELEYGKDIDAISGATISAISIIIDIEQIASRIHHEFSNLSLNK